MATAGIEFMYVDTSALIAIEFAEPAGPIAKARWNAAHVHVSAPLLEAEYISACRRDGRTPSFARLEAVARVLPPRSLAPEIARVLDAGYLRGADCWHLATALWLAPNPAELLFLTMDERQRAVAQRLGFQT